MANQKNSWLTGTAARNFVAISQWILGIRPDYEGLIVDPVIPEEWSEFRVNRKFRGVTPKIKVSRVGQGKVLKIFIDNKPIKGNVITGVPDGVSEIEVRVLIGSEG